MARCPALFFLGLCKEITLISTMQEKQPHEGGAGICSCLWCCCCLQSPAWQLCAYG